jgi:o-succinylbenzoate---CoA ligase
MNSKITLAENIEVAEAFFKNWDSGQELFQIFTSGSTGKPKEIKIHRRQMVASAMATGKKLDIQSSDIIHNCIPLDKIGGVMNLVRSKVWDISIQLSVPESNPVQHGPKGSIISLTPFQLYHILQHPHSISNLNEYRVVLIGGGDLDPLLELKLKSLKPDFYHTYGMTETCSHIALRKCNNEKVFLPLPGVEIVLNSSNCIKIKGEATDGQWIDTHDLAQLTQSGFIVTGRVDNIINSGGIKIQPEQVEAFLIETNNLPHHAIMCHGMPDAKLGQKVVLLINNHIWPHPVALHHVFPNLYWKPRSTIFLPEFIFTETGKLNRKATAELISRKP